MFGMQNLPGTPEGPFVVVPGEAVLRCTGRAFQPAVRDLLERHIAVVAQAQAAVFGATASVH